jgi:hypothetical protein
VPLKPCIRCGALGTGSYCAAHAPVAHRDRPSPSTLNRTTPTQRRRIKARDRKLRSLRLDRDAPRAPPSAGRGRRHTRWLKPGDPLRRLPPRRTSTLARPRCPVLESSRASIPAAHALHAGDGGRPVRGHVDHDSSGVNGARRRATGLSDAGTRSRYSGDRRLRVRKSVSRQAHSRIRQRLGYVCGQVGCPTAHRSYLRSWAGRSGAGRRCPRSAFSLAEAGSLRAVRDPATPLGCAETALCAVSQRCRLRAWGSSQGRRRGTARPSGSSSIGLPPSNCVSMTPSFTRGFCLRPMVPLPKKLRAAILTCMSRCFWRKRRTRGLRALLERLGTSLTSRAAVR